MGNLTIEEARRILLKEVGLSEALVKQEIERYTFRAPGQATSYFCGYQRMMELRMDTELKLGDKFDRHAFHDFILAQGLLPPSLLRQVVEEKFIAEYFSRFSDVSSEIFRNFVTLSLLFYLFLCCYVTIYSPHQQSLLSPTSPVHCHY